MRRLLVLCVAGCSFQHGSAAVSGSDAPGADAAGAVDAAGPDARVWLDAPAVPVSFVQSAGADSATATVSAMLTGARAAGDLDVVVISWPDPGITVASVGDTDGNTFTQVDTGIALTGHGVLAVYVAANVVARTGTDVVSATLSASTSGTLVVAEYRGLATASPIEATQASSGTTGTASDSTACTTTHQSNTMIEDQEVTVAGSYAATATLSSSGAWFARVIALRATD